MEVLKVILYSTIFLLFSISSCTDEPIDKNQDFSPIRKELEVKNNTISSLLYADRFELKVNQYPKKFEANKIIVLKNDSIINTIIDLSIVNEFKFILTKKYNRSYHCPSHRVYSIAFCNDSIEEIRYTIDLKMFKNLVVFSPPNYNKCIILKYSIWEKLIH